MQWLAVLLIAAVSNLDNLGVGIAFGVKGTRIGATENLIVGGITTAATAAAVTSGYLFSNILPPHVANLTGPLIIIAIGIATARASVHAPRRPTFEHVPWLGGDPPHDDHRNVSRRQAVLLGFALSINNLTTGVGAGVSGIPTVATIVSAGLFSLACVGGGSRCGKACGSLALDRHATLIGGILLMAVGLAMLL